MSRSFLRAVAVGAVLLTLGGLGFTKGPIRTPAPASAFGALATAAHAEPPASERKVRFYRNPMGLPDTSPVPKKDSMGMDYIPVYEDEGSDDATINVSPGKVQRTGVEVATVGRHRMTRTITAPGVVQLDETRVAVVAPRFDGYVVATAPVTTGAHLHKGDALATVFGQEILNEAARLLVEQGPGSRGGDAALPANALGGPIGATRRLRNLGVSDEFIDEVKRERRVPDTFTLRAPIDGAVLERNVVDGQGFKAGDVLFRVADHSLVWMMVDIAEGDIESVVPGQDVEVSVRAHPGRTFKGKVALIYPHLMKETRTARVRVEMPNPDLALLPEMYGDVEIATGGTENAIAVPASAVMDSGTRRVVLLAKGEGRYEPREVKIGRKGDGFVEIRDGVSEGDKVVVNGNFLIDAESNLNTALKALAAPAMKETNK
jgi:Cu(I)/Ag(I) efflux system membrane fusion protein